MPSDSSKTRAGRARDPLTREGVLSAADETIRAVQRDLDNYRTPKDDPMRHIFSMLALSEAHLHEIPKRIDLAVDDGIEKIKGRLEQDIKASIAPAVKAVVVQAIEEEQKKADRRASGKSRAGAVKWAVIGMIAGSLMSGLTWYSAIGAPEIAAPGSTWYARILGFFNALPAGSTYIPAFLLVVIILMAVNASSHD